jgi:formylglycine-generating enzyme required for sulfatase activity
LFPKVKQKQHHEQKQGELNMRSAFFVLQIVLAVSVPCKVSSRKEGVPRQQRPLAKAAHISRGTEKKEPALKSGKRSQKTYPNLQAPDPAGSGYKLQLNKDVAVRFVKIPAGEFVMGSPIKHKRYRARRHETQREVVFLEPVYMSTTEITQEWFATPKLVQI